MVRAAIPSLPRPCPVTPHPKAVLLVLLTLSRLGAPRTASLSSAASASVGRRSSPLRRGRRSASPPVGHLRGPCARPALRPPLRRHPLRASGRRRCAPPPALGRALRPAPLPSPPARASSARALAPCRLRRPRRVAPPASLPCCRCSIIEPAPDKCKTIPTSNNLRNFLVMLILFHLFVP